MMASNVEKFSLFSGLVTILRFSESQFRALYFTQSYDIQAGAFVFR